MTLRNRSAPCLAVLVGLLLSGCTGADEARPVAAPAASSTYTAEVPVLVPGRPGEEPTVVAPGEQGRLPDPDLHVQADVDFMRDMVLHHAQALEMADLAPERAASPRVRALAERIAAGQEPEIASMQAWLRAQGLPPVDPEGGGHAGHAGMPGMATPEQLTQLVAARGEAFDRLFLQLMTAHHEGALVMADDAVDARHPLVTELVDDIVATQSVEIARMQELLAGLA